MPDLTSELRRIADDGARHARPPAADEIIARGDRRRRHSMTAQSLGALSAAGVVGAGVALGLTLTSGAAPAHSGNTITTTAFTLVKHANGTTTLTINNNVIFEPAVLQSDLEQDGIPAIVTEGSFCSSSPAPAVTGQIISVQPGSAGGTPTVTINPSAMPAGTELSFGNFDLPNSGRTLIGLVDKDSYTCSSTPPASLRGLAVFAFQRKPAQ
jgi:hypothetical protein